MYWVLTGRFNVTGRERLSLEEQDLLSTLETRNTVLLARGAIYQDRKLALERCAAEWRLERSLMLASIT